MPSTRCLVLLCACGLFVVACILPAIATPLPLGPSGGRAGPYQRPGFLCLLFGPITLIETPSWFFAWLANPLALAGWVGLFFNRPRIARWLGGAACLLGCVTWGLLLTGSLSRLLVGYYLWHLSLLVGFLAGMVVSPKVDGSNQPGN